MDMPPESINIHNERAVISCLVKASNSFGLDPFVLMAIRQVEGGKVGRYSKNTNGTYDMGPMQINTIWLNEVKREFGWSKNDLIFDACKNVYVSAWILKNEIKMAKGNTWLGVGNYHSRTKKFHDRYRNKAIAAYKNLIKFIKIKYGNRISLASSDNEINIVYGEAKQTVYR